MIIIHQYLIALLPLLIIGITTVVTMITIAWRRNYFLNVILSVLGLSAALGSLWFVAKIGSAIDVTLLIRVDNCAIFYSSLVLLASLSICAFAHLWLKDFSKNREEFYLLLLIATFGGILLTYTNHLTSLFLGVEISSIPLFGLIGYATFQKYSLEATVKYAVLSAIASAFLLFGIALLYSQSGDLSFAGMGDYLRKDNVPHKLLLLVGLGLIIASLGFKLSLVPFHLWTADVYQGAPAPVSIFLAVESKVAVFIATTRFFLHVESGEIGKILSVLLGFIAFISIIFGNLMALLNQTNIKRLLGYSSISHLGYLLVVLIALQKRGEMPIETVGIYLTAYFLSSLGAFGVVSLISSPCRNQDIDSLFSYRGLFWKYPVLSAAMTVMMLSLAGIPMTLGFIGKFYILNIGVQENLWLLTAAVVVGSIISLCYYLRVAINLYLKTSPKCHFYFNVSSCNWQYSAGGIIVLISAFLVLFLGVYPQPLISIVQQAMPMM